MSGFRKAKAEQAALKVAMYGPPGSGKTFTALLVAEGLARLSGKRVAVVDTERGTDFYCQAVPERTAHPEAFDFDAMYTRSITEVLKSVKSLSHDDYAVVVIDSISHLWDAAMAAYTGNKNRAGAIPMHAWNRIKAPYKDLMAWALNSPFHVYLLGRQANSFEEDEQTGEMKAAGYKMRAEKETAHEPHVCIRMECVREQAKGKAVIAIPTAIVEKDRSGILQGRVIPWPNFDTLAAPILPLLGGQQARVQTEEEAGQQDGEALATAEKRSSQESARLREEYLARLKLCKSEATVKNIGTELTPERKRLFKAQDLDVVRSAYMDALDRAKGIVLETTDVSEYGEGDAA